VAFSFGGIVEDKLLGFLLMNGNTLPLMVVSVIGWVMALRSDLGKRVVLAQRGFGLLIAGGAGNGLQQLRDVSGYWDWKIR